MRWLNLKQYLQHVNELIRWLHFLRNGNLNGKIIGILLFRDKTEMKKKKKEINVYSSVINSKIMYLRFLNYIHNK